MLFIYPDTQGNQKSSKVPTPVKQEVQKAVPTIEVPALLLDELKEKTDNFGSKALIGEGSYGRVYFASLNNGKSVAVKKLDVAPEPESDNEFLTQVITIFDKFFFLSSCVFLTFYLFMLFSSISLDAGLYTLGCHGFKVEA